MTSSVSIPKTVFSDSVIRLMLCLKKFSHKALRNSNINTGKENAPNEFYLGTKLPSYQRMKFCHENKQRLQLLQLSLLPGDFVLHIPSHPTPQQLLITSTTVQRSLNVPPRGSLADGRVTYNHSH